MTYHHGNLRAEFLAAAAEAVARDGVAALNLRQVARQLGVTHAAPRHHFGDRRGLLTALATEGYRLLAERLRAAGDDFLEAGVAYVRFSLDKPGHFAVMYRPDLVDPDDTDLQAARAETGSALAAATAAHRRTSGRRTAPVTYRSPLEPLALLGWAAAHGLSHLASIGALNRFVTGHGTESLTNLARQALRELEPS